MGQGLEGKPYVQLRSLSLFSLEKGRLKGVIVVFSIFLREIRGAGADLFTVGTCDRTREKGRQLDQVLFEYQEKVFHPEHGQALRQDPQGNGHSTKPI